MNPRPDLSDVDFQEVYPSAVLVRSNKNEVTLPLNSNLGVIRPKTNEDDLLWHEAAEHTAEKLSDSWFNFLTSQTCVLQCNSTSTHLRYATCPAKTWDPNQQKSEMAKAGLDSSVLASFLPEPESDHPHAFPPLDFAILDLHSEEYFNKLVTALDSDSPSIIRGQVTSFIRNFDSPYLVTGHPYGRNDLLTLRHIGSGNNISHPVNIEKVVVIPEPEQHYLQPPNETVVENKIDSDSTTKIDKVPINTDLTRVARELGKYLNLLPTVSQACINSFISSILIS